MEGGILESATIVKWWTHYCEGFFENSSNLLAGKRWEDCILMVLKAVRQDKNMAILGVSL